MNTTWQQTMNDGSLLFPWHDRVLGSTVQWTEEDYLDPPRCDGCGNEANGSSCYPCLLPTDYLLGRDDGWNGRANGLRMVEFWFDLCPFCQVAADGHMETTDVLAVGEDTEELYEYLRKTLTSGTIPFPHENEGATSAEAAPPTRRTFTQQIAMEMKNEAQTSFARAMVKPTVVEERALRLAAKKMACLSDNDLDPIGSLEPICSDVLCIIAAKLFEAERDSMATAAVDTIKRALTKCALMKRTRTEWFEERMREDPPQWHNESHWLFACGLTMAASYRAWLRWKAGKGPVPKPRSWQSNLLLRERTGERLVYG